jgi:hypothetical protein
MKPGKLDLPTIWRGCDWGPVTLKWKDPNGAPFDLDGWLPKAQSLNIDLNPVITNSSQGETTLFLDRVQTSVLRLGVEAWDWVWESASPPFRYPPFLCGKVPIKQPQTRVTGQIVSLPPPANDNFLNATELTGDQGTIDGTNVGATRELTEPPGEASVWYNWTASRSWTAYLTIGTTLLNLSVYTGNTVGALDLITASQGTTQVSWPATEGTIYRVRVFRNTATTPFSLNWLLQLPP